MGRMIRHHQFSLASLLKDVAGIAIALGVLRFSLIPGDDAYVLPVIGLILGIVIGLPLRRVGEGAFVGCLATTLFMYASSYLDAPRE